MSQAKAYWPRSNTIPHLFELVFLYLTKSPIFIDDLYRVEQIAAQMAHAIIFKNNLRASLIDADNNAGSISLVPNQIAHVHAITSMSSHLTQPVDRLCGQKT